MQKGVNFSSNLAILAYQKNIVEHIFELLYGIPALIDTFFLENSGNFDTFLLLLKSQ